MSVFVNMVVLLCGVYCRSDYQRISQELRDRVVKRPPPMRDEDPRKGGMVRPEATPSQVSIQPGSQYDAGAYLVSVTSRKAFSKLGFNRAFKHNYVIILKCSVWAIFIFRVLF